LYKFQFNGKLVRESTKQGNDKVARQVEAAHRTSLAKGGVGIREKKKAPTFGEFAEKQFLPWVESTFSAKRKTWLYYRNGVRRLKDYAPLVSLPLDDAKLGEKVSGYIAHRQAKGTTGRQHQPRVASAPKAALLGSGMGICRAGSQDKNAQR
jgi:hypothetical protein